MGCNIKFCLVRCTGHPASCACCTSHLLHRRNRRPCLSFQGNTGGLGQETQADSARHKHRSHLPCRLSHAENADDANKDETSPDPMGPAMSTSASNTSSSLVSFRRSVEEEVEMSSTLGFFPLFFSNNRNNTDDTLAASSLRWQGKDTLV